MNLKLFCRAYRLFSYCQHYKEKLASLQKNRRHSEVFLEISLIS